MTPAEQLAQTKQRTRKKRNAPAISEAVLWECRLLEAREKVNLSMHDVAAAVGLSVSAYFRIEKGFADVSLSNARALAKFFGSNVYYLWPEWKGNK